MSDLLKDYEYSVAQIWVFHFDGFSALVLSVSGTDAKAYLEKHYWSPAPVPSFFSPNNLATPPATEMPILIGVWGQGVPGLYDLNRG